MYQTRECSVKARYVIKCEDLYDLRGFFVSSLWSNAILQIDAAQLTLLAVMLHMMDSLIKLQLEKFTQTVAETALNSPLLSYLSSFVYVFKLH